MMVDAEKIKVGDRIRKDFGDIEELAADIAKNGLINPPAVTPDLELIAGERRLRAIKHLGWPQVEVNVMTVRDALHQFELEVSENENRKDFTFSEKMQWAKLLKEEYGAKAELVRLANLRRGVETSPECLKSDTREGRVDEIIGKEVGIGGKDKVRQAEYIIDHATPEIIQLLDEGDLSINAAYRKLRAEADALRRQNEAFIQESAEHSRQQKTLFEAKEKLEQENVVLKRLGDVDLNVEINQLKERELKQYEQIQNLKRQLIENREKTSRLEKEKETFLKADGFAQALEDERDRLQERLNAILDSTVKQTTDVEGDDIDSILGVIQLNVERLCGMEIDLDRADLVALNNSISKTIQPLNRLCDELRKKINALPPAA
jgi:ParB family chromosome partitioning protein